MESGMQNSEYGVVVAGDHDDDIRGDSPRGKPEEGAVFRDHARRDIAILPNKCAPHFGPGTLVSPPVACVPSLLARYTFSPHMRNCIRERRFVESGCAPSIFHPKSMIHLSAGRRVKSLPFIHGRSTSA